MPVEAVLVECDDDVWLEPTDGVEDVRLELRMVDPGEHPILVVEQYDVPNTENPCGVAQLTRSSVAKPPALVSAGLAVLPRAMLAVREAQERDPDAGLGAPGEQAPARQRLVVGVCEDR